MKLSVESRILALDRALDRYRRRVQGLSEEERQAEIDRQLERIRNKELRQRTYGDPQ